MTGSDQDKPALEALDPKTRDNPLNFLPEQTLELADEDRAIMPGLHWLEAQPEAVQETKALLTSPKKLTPELITALEALFSEPEAGVTVSQEDLRHFVHQQEGNWVMCVSGEL